MVGTTTIVFTDISSSSGLVQRLGDGAAAQVVSRHLRGVRAEAERCQGRVTKTLGDGLMALFGTVYDGVRAAIAMQQVTDLAEREQDCPALGLRIGVNVGDVVDDGSDDVFGSAVVVARRLCDAAGPRKILVSEIVRILAGSRPDIHFVPLDPIALKGLTEPIGATEVQWTPLPKTAPIRVVVADDAALIRSGLVRLLTESSFEVIAEADDYESLITAIDRDPPDLVITDIRMPPHHRDEGLRAATYIRSVYPHVAVLILSQHIEASAATNLLDGQTSGVGYLLKERVRELDEFITTARQVTAGVSVIDPLVTEQLLSKRRANANVSVLTDREREVLALMAQGLSNQAICADLFLSAKTVETHVRSIFTKFGLPEEPEGNRRVQAVLRWLQADPSRDRPNQDRMPQYPP
jgi:DNA-binding NarL/FixJ family response regulator/class 3 adenylate cyclase